METQRLETTQRTQAPPVHDCFAAHAELVEQVQWLAARMGANVREAMALRLGASCIGIAAQRALAARDEREAILSWRECDLGERHIRSATYFAFAHGHIQKRDYDDTFEAAICATRARQDELLRLRQRLKLLSVV